MADPAVVDLGHSIDVEVPFHDVDSMGIVWHGHYVKYLELARCALLDEVGFGYHEMASSGYSWPVVELKSKFVNAARFGQVLEVQAVLKEWDMRLKIEYLLLDKQTRQRITKAHTVQVAVAGDSGEMLLPLPGHVQAIFQAFADAR